MLGPVQTVAAWQKQEVVETRHTRHKRKQLLIKEIEFPSFIGRTTFSGRFCSRNFVVFKRLVYSNFKEQLESKALLLGKIKIPLVASAEAACLLAHVNEHS
jgi:hypothetical protein